MLAGVRVFRPLSEDTPIDLLVLTGDKRVLKCQCKYLYEKLGRHCHCMNLYSVRKNGPGDKAVKHVYRADEVDFFLGYCVEDDGVYVIPYAAAEGRSELFFWITRRPKGIQNQGRVFDCSAWRAAYQLLK